MDLNDRAQAGTLPADPFEGARPLNGAARRAAAYADDERAAIQADSFEHSDSDAPDAPPHEQADERAPGTVADVIAAWRKQGSLVHEPTELATLDELTGGGPVYGTRWYLSGAPDAGKTALLIQIAATYAGRGIAVGLLAVDEESGDLVTRLAQRQGWSRYHCEARDPVVLDEMLQALEPLPIRFYDASWTIESAARDLADWAAVREPDAPRAMLGIDSVQTVTCDAELTAVATGRALSTSEAVTERSRAIRAVATRHRLIAIATSELNRGAYAGGEHQTSTLAAGKWSGAIEYSARVLLGLRSVAGESDLIDVEFAKNKHGPRDQRLYLRIDRRSQSLAEAEYTPAPSDTGARRNEKALERVRRDVVAVAQVLLEQPGIGVRELRSAVRARTGAGHERVDAAVSALGTAISKGTGRHGARPMTLDVEALPPAIRSLLEVSHG